LISDSPVTRPGLRRGRSLRYILSGLLTVLFLWVAFRGTDFPRLLDLMRHANYWWILAMFACLMLSHLIRAWRWRYLLEPIKQGIGMRNLFAGVMIGYLFNNILPRAGEIARPYAIGKSESISRSSAFGTIVVERIIDTFSFLVLAALLPLVYNGPLLEAFPWLQDAGVIISVGTTVGLAVLVILMVRRDWADGLLLKPLRSILPRELSARIDSVFHAFLDGFLFLKVPANFIAIAASSVIVWFLYILMIYLAFFAFGLGNLGFRGAVVVQTISSIGVAIPTPGSTGSYHAFTSQSLSRLFKVDPEVALGYATVTHAVSFIGVSLVGLYYYVRDQITVADAVGKTEEAAT